VKRSVDPAARGRLGPRRPEQTEPSAGKQQPGNCVRPPGPRFSARPPSTAPDECFAAVAASQLGPAVVLLPINFFFFSSSAGVEEARPPVATKPFEGGPRFPSARGIRRSARRAPGERSSRVDSARPPGAASRQRPNRGRASLSPRRPAPRRVAEQEAFGDNHRIFGFDMSFSLPFFCCVWFWVKFYRTFFGRTRARRRSYGGKPRQITVAEGGR